MPLSGSECVQKVVTCWMLGRKLQLISAAHSPPSVGLASSEDEDGGTDAAENTMRI